jgi:hypothetical protein
VKPVVMPEPSLTRTFIASSIFSLANYANAIGLNASQASIISALLNLGQALGRPPIGCEKINTLLIPMDLLTGAITDSDFSDTIGRINMAALMTFLAGLFALVIWIFAKSYGRHTKGHDLNDFFEMWLTYTFIH